MFSDLAQTEFQRNMMYAVKESEKIDDPQYGAMIDKMIDGMIPEAVDVKAATSYKPEYSWNYEAGAHLTLLESR